MSELYEILEKIQKRPLDYLGEPSIFYLEAFLWGYFYDRKDLHFPAIDRAKEFKEFTNWIQEKYQVEFKDYSWAKIIFFYSEDEQDALEQFFKLLAEFQNKNQQNGRVRSFK